MEPDGNAISLKRWGSDHLVTLRANHIEKYEAPSEGVKFWTLHLRVQLALTNQEVLIGELRPAA
jgi:hypothetical protein